MFEDYLEDADTLATMAAQANTEREVLCLYRASVFHTCGALESFVNYIGETFAAGGTLPPFELAFMLDKKFAIVGGGGVITETTEFHRLEDKIRFLLTKFCPLYAFSSEPSWSQFQELKTLRDSITHPKSSEEQLTPPEFERSVKRGLGAAIVIIDTLCRGIFRRPLRKRLLDLKP